MKPQKIIKISGHPALIKFNNKLLISNDPICLDLGACIGNFTTQLINIKNGRGYYYLYEPNKELYKTLNNLNYKYNIEVYNKAISFKNGVERFYIGNIKKSSSLIKTHRNLSEEYYDVETITLGDILKPFDKVDIVKMDIEGSEVEVLLSTDIDELNKINQLLVEFHLNKNVGYEESDIEKVEEHLKKSDLIKIYDEGNDVIFINKRLMI